MITGFSGIRLIGWGGYPHSLHGPFDLLEVVPFDNLFAVVEHNQRNYVPCKIFFPFIVEFIVFLNIPCLEGDA